ELTSELQVRKIVSQNLPCQFDPAWPPGNAIVKELQTIDGYREFQIEVNKCPVYKEFPTELAGPHSYRLEANDKTELGFIWWCENEQGTVKAEGNQFRGFRLRVKNFAVGPVSIFDDENLLDWGSTRALKGRVRLDRFVGELHITNEDIIPDTPRNNLEQNARSREAVELIRAFYSWRINEAYARASYNGAKRQITAAEEFIDGANSNDYVTACEHLRELKERHGELTAKPQTNSMKWFLRRSLANHKREIEGLIKKLEARTARTKDPTSK